MSTAESLMMYMRPLLRSGQGGTLKEYYTLESLLFLLKNVSLSHPSYVARAGVSQLSKADTPSMALCAYMYVSNQL